MNRFVALLAILGLLATAPAWGQSADAKALADARQLIQVLKLQGVREQVVRGTVQVVGQQMLKANKGKDAQVKAFVEQTLLPVLRARQADITEQQALLLTKYFSAAELRQLLTFYKSPVGAKLVTTFPTMLGDIQKFASDWANAVLRGSKAKLDADAKKRGLAVPAS